jgi:hypothetical protein
MAVAILEGVAGWTTLRGLDAWPNGEHRWSSGADSRVVGGEVRLRSSSSWSVRP